ncbi:MAG: cytochrome c3 family protein [Verrucomicrobiota bacterium]
MGWSITSGLKHLWDRVPRHGRAPIALALLVLATGGLVISCSTMDRVVMAPPAIPGAPTATFAGSESCAQCHEPITRDFKTASHALLQAKGPHAANVGCESCHGPGSVHNETGGGPRTIINPAKSPEVCFQCHLEMRGRFNLPHHHPVLEGKMTCTDCHDPHKSSAIKGGGTQLASENETCFRCHAEQRGPFVFEHEASREGCRTCHEPHGSIHPRMLTERSSTLCLKCHFQQQTAGGVILIGGRDHSAFLTRGSCWTAGCHEAVHGSRVNSSLRF